MKTLIAALLLTSSLTAAQASAPLVATGVPGGQAGTASVTVSFPPKLNVSLACAQVQLLIGQSMQCTLTSDQPAYIGGAQFSLSFTPPSPLMGNLPIVLQFPATVTIAEASASVTFTVARTQ
jgi:hypothetical protein